MDTTLQIPDGVCQTCYNLDAALLKRLRKSASGSEMHLGFELDANKLRSSAESGCEACIVIQKGVSNHLEWLNELKPNRTYKPGVTLSLAFYEGHGLVASIAREGDGFGYEVEFYTKLNDTPTYPAFGYGNKVPRTLDAGICVENLQVWLASCLNDHPECVSTEPAQSPGRLVDLELFERGYVKLVDWSEREHVKYVALSHCWGTIQPMTTTKSNLTSHLDGIPAAKLPKTFNEAAQITSQLGIRYLWIDSLCIIQDDLQDWEIESTKMASIYGSSYLTIAVLHSPNSHGGCFLDRNWNHPWMDSSISGARSLPNSLPNYSIPIIVQRGDAELTVMTRLKHIDPHNHFFGRSCRPKTPLETRAWTMQERLLAPRTLLIHPEELVWECRSMVACECRSIETNRPESSPFATQLLGDLKKSIQPRHSETADDAGANWLRIVSAYSRLKLTKSSDTLPALSGLADHFSGFMSGEYRAGLWTGDFPRSLLWGCVGDRTKGPPRIVDESLPSWSWTAVCSGARADAGVLYDLALLWGEFVADENFAFVSCERSPSASNTGEYSGEVLRVSGKMRELKSDEDADGSQLDIATMVKPDSPGCYFWCDDNQPKLLVKQRLFCILLGSDVGLGMDSKDSMLVVYYLVLRPAGREERYRRVGVLEFNEGLYSRDKIRGADIVTIDIF